MLSLIRAAAAVAFIAVACIVSAEKSYADSHLIYEDRKPAFMLYARKGFGGSSDPAALPYLSFRIEQPIQMPGRDSELTFDRRNMLPLAEFRLTAGNHRSFYLSNVPMFDSMGSAGSGGSSGEDESWRSPWFWAIAIALGLAVSCATETLICEDDDKSPGL